MTIDREAVLRVDGLSVTLDGNRILEDISFEVARGDILTILGPNGAGKTVLLRALLGALPHEGQVHWQAGVRIGYVPQRLPYIKDMPLSVRDFFTLKRPAPGTACAPLAELLDNVGLPPTLGKRRMGDLSSGQFQRILIAWAMAGDPGVLLFDEPTTGVDVTGEETVYGLLSRMHRERGLTILIITHDLAVVHRLSSVVLCLNKRLVCQGPPIEVLTPQSLRQLYGKEVTWYQHEHHHD